ncbi:DotU family type IV/VI secretion system protein [Polyangium aurulentum]|uniref:DotU family type IV/VI secretion system protein n=1 Tax=Polyangium aurulentum TaxID=2567896 RepID=UPI0010AE34B4|nr:DotU family type IV/VI secretion system protein [Polyangium aurulentum]UQA56291.1 DotU family type IV/VI secretion system protein [Polyangium aurulentum]
MNRAPFDSRSWTKIVDAYRDICGLIDQTLGGAKPVADLQGLFSAIWRRLDELRRSLPEDPEPLDLLAPLAFFFDERVLLRLSADPVGRELSWPMLGRAFASDNAASLDAFYAGDAFFERARELNEDSAPLLVQVYLFCLDEGFSGRHAHDPEALRRERETLFRRLSLRAPPPPTSASTSLASPRAPRPLWHFVIAVIAGAVVWQVILWRIASLL